MGVPARIITRIERLLGKRQLLGLCRALRRRNHLARRRAAQALGELGDPAAVSCLLRACDDPDEYVRRWAIQALQQIGGAGAAEALGRLLFGRRIPEARLAEQALLALDDPFARAALHLRDILSRNQWVDLNNLDETERRALLLALEGDQYADWPSAKRQRVLAAAVSQGLRPPPRFRDDLAAAGLYVSGVHTVSDLLVGLRHRNPAVRAAAARAFAGAPGRRWLRSLLYRRYLAECKPSGDLQVAAALGRVLSTMGDQRPLAVCGQNLLAGSSSAAAQAAYLLADIGTPPAIELLFEYAAEPPPPPAVRNTLLALSALERAGPLSVEALRSQIVHPTPARRRLLVEVVRRSGHTDQVRLLSKLAGDPDPGISQAALSALVAVNSGEAARAIADLSGELPQGAAMEALAAMTHPAGPEHLLRLWPGLTALRGRVSREGGHLVTGAEVQVVQEHDFGEPAGWGWKAVSARMPTLDDGTFLLVLPACNPDVHLRLKVVLPASRSDQEPQVYAADIRLLPGKLNEVTARVDTFLSRLVVAPA
jgi:HEAT repeat protein